VDGSQNPVDGSRNPVDGSRNPVDGPRNPVDGPRNPVDGPRNPVDAAWPSAPHTTYASPTSSAVSTRASRVDMIGCFMRRCGSFGSCKGWRALGSYYLIIGRGLGQQLRRRVPDGRSGGLRVPTPWLRFGGTKVSEAISPPQ
jgi:hypothetical protein